MCPAPMGLLCIELKVLEGCYFYLVGWKISVLTGTGKSPVYTMWCSFEFLFQRFVFFFFSKDPMCVESKHGRVWF